MATIPPASPPSHYRSTHFPSFIYLRIPEVRKELPAPICVEFQKQFCVEKQKKSCLRHLHGQRDKNGIHKYDKVKEVEKVSEMKERTCSKSLLIKAMSVDGNQTSISITQLADVHIIPSYTFLTSFVLHSISYTLIITVPLLYL